jgi:hypothetical protein
MTTDNEEGRVDPFMTAVLALALIAGAIALGNMSGCWFVQAW